MKKIGILIVLVMVFGVVFMPLNACTFGPGNETPSLDRPNLPRQSGTLTQSQTRNLIDSWDDFVHSSDIPAFSFSSHMHVSEVSYWGTQRETMIETLTRSMVSNGTNFRYISDGESIVNGQRRQSYTRMYLLNGELFEVSRESDRNNNQYQRAVRFDVDRFSLDYFLELELSMLWNMRNVEATRHGAYFRLLYQLREDGISAEFEMIFDNQYRLVWASINGGGRDGRDSVDVTLNTRIVWAMPSSPIPSPNNMAQFNRPTAQNMFIDFDQIWWINDDDGTADAYVFYWRDIFNVIRFSMDIVPHSSWFDFVIEVVSGGNLVRIHDGWRGDWSVEFLGVGVVELIIRSVAVPTVYRVLVINVSENQHWWW